VTDLAAFALCFLSFVVALVAAVLAQIARASVAGHVPGAGSHAGGGRAGDGKSTTDFAEKSREDSDDVDRRLLRLKRELLEQWAKEGQTIDLVAEAKAELVALEVVERASAWRDHVAAAADEPLNPERPFAS
jgi:hypothetical protein